MTQYQGQIPPTLLIPAVVTLERFDDTSLGWPLTVLQTETHVEKPG